MKTCQLAFEVLNKVVYQDIPFSLALKNEWKYKNIDKNQRGEVSALVGCCLRHFFVFELRIKDFSKEPSNNFVLVCSLSLANLFFLKRIEERDFDLLASEQLTDEENNLYKDFIESFKNSPHLIPDRISSNSVEFLSYRYNTPLWLVKMWNKHFGLNALYKILKSNNQKSDIYVKSLSRDPVENVEFEKTPYSNLYKYVGKTILQKNPLYASKNLFPYSLAMNEMMDKIDIDPIRGIAIYSAYSNNLLLDLASRTSKYIKLDLITPAFQSIVEAKRNIENYGFENVRLYEASASSMITCISQKVHTFFVLPNNSRFSLLKATPDYSLKIDQTKLDSIIKGEEEALDEAAMLIDDGGSLVYCLDTINQKEGYFLIESFLKKHSEFSVVEEKQYLGIGSTSCLYYAILLKGHKND